MEIDHPVDVSEIKRARRLTEFRRLQAQWDAVNPLVTRISFVQYCQMQDILESHDVSHLSTDRYSDQIHAVESTFILLKFCNLLVVRRTDTGNDSYEPEMLARMLGKELNLSDRGCNRLKGLFAYYIASSENRLNDSFLKGNFVPTQQLVASVEEMFDEIAERISTKRIKPDVALEVLAILTSMLNAIDSTAGKVLQVMISDQKKKLVGKNKQVSFKLF